MLFAAKIQKDTYLQVSSLQTQQNKDLCLTNFSLDESESMAFIYLSTKHAKSMLIVSLEKPQLSAYHTNITLSHEELSHCNIQSRNGDVFVIGRWIDTHQVIDNKASTHKEETVVKSRQQHKQERRQKRSAQTPKISNKSTQKRQQQTPALTQSVRQSSRVRTPTVSQPSPTTSSIKSGSSSKGKSLLDMMNNLDEEDDEESSYSEEDDESDDSSEEQSSEQKDAHETKKMTTAEKIRRKNMPASINTKQHKPKSKNDKNGQQSRESSDEQQQKSKKDDKINRKQEFINTQSPINPQRQQKPFDYVIPSRLPDFLSKK